MQRIDPIELKGEHAALVPLSQNHCADLQEAAEDGTLHRLWYTTIPSAEGMAADINRRLRLQEAGSMVPFAVLDAAGKAVGMTTYMNVEMAHRRVEIGSTWYRASVQRTPLNSECKLMLLGHAFEALGCNCVEFRTHVMNAKSRRAIERLGAKLDGVLRSHMVMANGTVRDTAAYSILAHEWPAVKANLRHRLGR